MKKPYTEAINKVNDILASYNPTKVGRWVDELNSDSDVEAYEELYCTDAEDKEFFLHGNLGVRDLNSTYSYPKDRITDSGDELVFINCLQARLWAARYLPTKNFSNFFGETTEYKKLLEALDPQDIYHLMMDAKEARSEGYSAEAYASDAALPLTDPYGYCGCNLFAAYELCTRLWHLWDKYNAPTDCD